MNTTDALNASLILLRQNTSEIPQATDDGGSDTLQLVISSIMVFVLITSTSVTFLVCIRRIRKGLNGATISTVLCDKETDIRLVSEKACENNPDLASKLMIKDASRTDPYGKEDVPLLAIAGTDKNSSNSTGSGSGSGSAFEFDDDLQTDTGYPNRNVFSSNNERPMSIVSEQCNDYSLESVLIDESNLILDDQLTHATERFGDGCSDTVEHTEECIEYVKHVKSPVWEDGEDPDETCPKILEQTEPKDIDYNLLDWNRVFEYLAERIEASKWIRFFNTLYGNSQCELKVDVSVKLDQVEHDFKERAGRGDTVSHLIYQFKAWKQFAGRNAKYTMIDKTLKELQWNDKLDEFRTYMRNPPLLSSNCDHLQNQLMLNNSFGSLQSVMSLPFSSGTAIGNAVNDQRNMHHSRDFQSQGKVCCTYEMSFKVNNKQPNCESVDHERNDPDGVSDIFEDSVNCGRNVKEVEQQTTHNTTEQSFRVKEVIDKACSSNLQKRSKSLSSNIKGKGVNFNTKRKRKKVQKSRRARKQTHSRPKLSKDSFHMLLSTFLQSAKVNLKRDMYEIYLQHTISNIVKETRVSENVILSLTCEEYHDMEISKTKRENLYIMYSQNIRLILGDLSFEELQCFTKYARQQVIDRLAENIDKESQKYLFIDFDGKRIHSKETKPELADDMSSDGSSYITIEDGSTLSEEDDP